MVEHVLKAMAGFMVVVIAVIMCSSDGRASSEGYGRVHGSYNSSDNV